MHTSRKGVEITPRGLSIILALCDYWITFQDSQYTLGVRAKPKSHVGFAIQAIQWIMHVGRDFQKHSLQGFGSL